MASASTDRACKFCGRIRGSLSTSGREVKWRRPTGFERSSFSLVFRADPKWLQSVEGMHLKGVADRCASDPDFRTDLLNAVNEWESKRASGQYTSSKRVATAYTADETVFEGIVGYAWPVSVYKRVKVVTLSATITTCKL